MVSCSEGVRVAHTRDKLFTAPGARAAQRSQQRCGQVRHADHERSAIANEVHPHVRSQTQTRPHTPTPAIAQREQLVVGRGTMLTVQTALHVYARVCVCACVCGVALVCVCVCVVGEGGNSSSECTQSVRTLSALPAYCPGSPSQGPQYYASTPRFCPSADGSAGSAAASGQPCEPATGRTGDGGGGEVTR